MSDNFYATSGINNPITVATNFTGALANACTLSYFKVGKQVTFSITPVSSASLGAAFVGVAALLPAGFRPASNIYYAIPVSDNSAAANGSIRVNSTGQIFYASNNQLAFAGTGSITLFEVCFTFLVP